MRTAEECFKEFEELKSSGLATETALLSVFSTMRRSISTIDLGASVDDKVLFRLIERLRLEWKKLLKKLKQGNYGPIEKRSFERFHKQANPDHHRIWTALYKKK